MFQIYATIFKQLIYRYLLKNNKIYLSVFVQGCFDFETVIKCRPNLKIVFYGIVNIRSCLNKFIERDN
jgi:hypothetical protein